jgi:hypothetical protein
MLYVGPYRGIGITLFLTRLEVQFFWRLFMRCHTGSGMVVPTFVGPTGAYGYCTQPAADGRTGYLLPGWLAAH